MPEDPKEESETESEEEDDVLDDEAFEEKPQLRTGRQSVSAEAYGEWNVKKAFQPPVIPKSDDQKDRLKACLSKSFMFANLDDTEFNVVVLAMKEVLVAQQEVVITRGDDGDELFVVESGSFDCSILVDGAEKVVKTCSTGDVFGELALLYNTARAATVASTMPSVCWSLDRETFNFIVKEATQQKRQRYDSFLAKVPLLATMDQYERSQLADALRVESKGDGETIVTQGESGDKFYIVEEGAASATKDGSEVMQYGVGDYFGELALINNQERAATVTAKGATKLLTIDSTTFKRLLDVKDLNDRASRYT